MRTKTRASIWVGFGVLLFLCFMLIALVSRPEDALPLPRAIAGYPLRSHTFGPEAADEIRRMHRGTFPLTGAAIGIYGNSDAILWVAETWGGVGASILERGMTEAIERVDSPFTPVGVRNVQGVKVHELTGTGQVHFYFRLGNQVYWLAIAPERAEQGLQEVLEFARRAN